MKGLPEERAIELGRYIVEHRATVRQAAGVFAVSKSTVHKDVTARLRMIAPQLYEQCRAVLEVNKYERHIRGGQATREKYAARRRKTQNRQPRRCPVKNSVENGGKQC